LARALDLGVEIRLGCDVEAISDAGEVTYCGETVQADLVVAADGVRSLARDQISGESAPEFTGQVAWRAVIDAALLPEGILPDDTTLFLGPGRHLVTYPLRGGQLRNVVAVEERGEWAEESWRASSDPSELLAAFSGWCAPVETIVNAVEECYLWGLFTHPELGRWSRGRVVLLGDACHPMLPFMAQGAGMALEDAWVLAACLDRVEQEAGLAEYEARRKPRATRMQAASAGNAGLYHYRTPVLRQGLHLGMRVISGLAPERMLERFDWVYGEDVTAQAASSTQIGT
jgi:salicylate hydroxylase